jgi:hippurate hydrolase
MLSLQKMFFKIEVGYITLVEKCFSHIFSSGADMNMQVQIPIDIQKMMVEWRHDFHAHPELGGEERRTADRVARLLRDCGIKVHTGIGGTGVVGVLKKGQGTRSLGLRADMDALAIAEENSFAYRSRHEGRMHACGHDGHMAMLLGAARQLVTGGEFDGTVYFIFQPAEEPGHGAKAMLADGLFRHFPADAVYGMHNMPSLPLGTLAVRPGPVMASEDHFEIVITGQGTHAALPHLGIDPILVGSGIVTALQSIVSRSLNPVENAVVSVTEFITDGTTNVLPTTVTLKGDTRSFLPSVQQQIEARMHSIAHAHCEAYGASCNFTYSNEFVATINAPVEAKAAAEVARQVVGDNRLNLTCPPFMASEDFGEMLRVKPGCYLFIGNGAEETGSAGLHNPCYDFHDGNLAVGAEFWVRLVEAQLNGC